VLATPVNHAPADRIPLVILGTSLFAPEVADLIDDTGRYVVTAFIENWDRDKTSEPFLGRPVVWIDDAGSLAATHHAVCSLGTTRRKSLIEQVASLGFRFARVEHPDARISLKSEVGDGSIISVGVIVAAHTRIGRHVIVNRGTLIGHHVAVHDYVTISPGANIAGAVTVGEGAYVGMGAIVLDRLTVGAHAVVGAGAVVTRDVPAGAQVMGVPAKITGEALQDR
jgi:sugar O-acyltransferase (sialic acid O-acetyltransferase NeuD family)